MFEYSYRPIVSQRLLSKENPKPAIDKSGGGADWREGRKEGAGRSAEKGNCDWDVKETKKKTLSPDGSW